MYLSVSVSDCVSRIFTSPLVLQRVLPGSRAGGTVQIVMWVYHIVFSEIWMLLTKAISI